MIRIAIVFLFVAFGHQALAEDALPKLDTTTTVDYLRTTLEKSSCTPICGNPTCCIAYNEQATSHISDVEFEEFKKMLGDAGMKAVNMGSPMRLDDALAEELGLDPVVDLNSINATQDAMSTIATDFNAPLSTGWCCSPCSTGTCCGPCWGF